MLALVACAIKKNQTTFAAACNRKVIRGPWIRQKYDPKPPRSFPRRQHTEDDRKAFKLRTARTDYKFITTRIINIFSRRKPKWSSGTEHIKKHKSKHLPTHCTFSGVFLLLVIRGLSLLPQTAISLVPKKPETTRDHTISLPAKKVACTDRGPLFLIQHDTNRDKTNTVHHSS